MVLVVLAGWSAACGPRATPSVEAEEAAVYAAAIETYLGRRPAQLVLQEETALFIGGDTAETLGYLTAKLPGLEADTLDSLQARNDRAYAVPLSTARAWPFPCVLLTAAEMHSFFEPSAGGWDAFYARYPESQGIMELSRVGFNAEMTQALVYVGNQSHWLAGAGFYYLLAKEGGTWKVVGQVMVWIS